MKRSSGFTLIELLVTVTIMVILMTLAVANIRSTQVRARDDARRTQVEAIARSFETRYKEGSSIVAGWNTKGVYPGLYEYGYALGDTNWCGEADSLTTKFNPCVAPSDYVTQYFLPGITRQGLQAPGSSDQSLKSTWGYSVDFPTYQAQIMSATEDNYYVYEPLMSNGGPCLYGECVRFNIYYQTENQDDVEPHVVKSRNR